MLYSHTLEEQKFFSFSLFLKSLMKGESSYADVVCSVLKEVKEYLAEKKDIYSLNSEYYPITMFFASKAKTTIDNINLDCINSSDYETLLESLENRPLIQQCHESTIC